MIIETAYKQGDIVSAKLASGEEIIGRFESAANGDITLIKPMMLVAQATAQGQGLGLGPFMFSASPDSKFTIRQAVLSCVVKTEAELAKQYTTSTTGIALP